MSDSRLSVAVATAIVEDRRLAIDEIESVPDALAQTTYDTVRRDGRTLPYFPWPPMLLAVPGVLVARAAGIDVESWRPSSPNETWPIEVPTASAIVAATSVVMALIAREVARGHRRAHLFAIASALVFAFGTSAWSTASRALWQHTPAMFFWSLALFAALRSKEQKSYLWVLGLALAAGSTMRPTSVVPMIILSIWAIVSHRTDAWRVVVGGAVVLVPFATVNVLEYGSFLAPYYAGSRVGTEAAIPIGESFLMNLVSPSRGLLIYTPMVLLAPVGLWIRRQQHILSSLDIAAGTVVLFHLVVIAIYGSTGGSSYGNRMFTEALPFIAYLCMPAGLLLVDETVGRRTKLAVVALVVSSIIITVPGALMRSAYCWSASPTFVDDDPSRVWDWSDPQMLRPIARLRSGHSFGSIVAGACDMTHAAALDSSGTEKDRQAAINSLTD